MSEKDGLDALDRSSVDASALEGNPFERKTTWRSAFRAAGTRGWLAAALAIGVLVLGWRLRPPTSPDETLRSAPDGIAHLTAADPHALMQQIVAELRAAGVEAQGYEQLGIDGIDADLPQPVTPDIRHLLARHHIPVPPDGVLRVEILQSRAR